MKLRWIQYIRVVPRYPVLVGDTVMPFSRTYKIVWTISGAQP